MWSQNLTTELWVSLSLVEIYLRTVQQRSCWQGGKDYRNQDGNAAHLEMTALFPSPSVKVTFNDKS